MPPGAYDVWPAILAGYHHPEINYFHAVEASAHSRIMKLAGSIITQMERVEVSGLFADETRGMKSIGNEGCWYPAR